MKNKVVILVISIVLVLIILSTTTYALFFRKDKLENTESYTSGILDIVIENDEEGLGDTLNLANSLPITDEEGKKSTPYRFKITNKGNISYTFDLLLNNTTSSNAISNNYIKIMIDNNEPVLLSDLTDNIIASDLTLNPSQSKIINVRIWLDINTPNTEIGKNFSAKIVSNGVGSEPSLDSSGANAPKLVDNMIPVMYNGSNWVKADSTNTNATYKWYDYTNKQWANAVLVSSTNRNTYVNANVGTVIPESDVLAYYVWIPRYKYKVWNINKVIGTDSYNAQTTGIDITFEQGTTSTGDINCNNYSFASVSSSTRSETCSGTNGQYYTHPAFTFGDIELTGIWVGKFEISAPTDSSCYTNQSYANCETADLEPRTKPNVKSWRYNFVDSFEGAIQNMQSSGNEYGLSTDTSKVDSHMLKNMEWGAVAYLTHSDYGRCNGSSCEEVTINSNSSYTTGGGNYVSNVAQSSTGNIYGIYDLSGGAWEYVMGNMSKSAGSYVYNLNYGDGIFKYSASTAKYIDTYAYGTSYKDQTAYNRARLGDATGEVVVSSGTAWNNDYAYFVYSSYPWFRRGGLYYNGSFAGVFFFNTSDGDSGNYYSARAALLAL